MERGGRCVARICILIRLVQFYEYKYLQYWLHINLPLSLLNDHPLSFEFREPKLNAPEKVEK